MAVVLKNSGNTGTLHIVDEATNREFMRFDPTYMTIFVPAGVKIIHEDEAPAAAMAVGDKIPLDEFLKL